MADTTFAPGTVIKADWLQDVNDVVYGGGISSDAVTGPTSSNDNELVLFDGTTGKILKEGGILIDDMVTVNGTQVVSNKTFDSSCVWASVIQETNGGTGINAYTTGDIIYSPSTNNLTTLPVGSEGKVLTVTSGLPSWQTPGVGGSDLETGSVVGDILYSDATNSLAKLAIGTAGKVLTASAGGIPEWSTPVTAGATTSWGDTSWVNAFHNTDRTITSDVVADAQIISVAEVGKHGIVSASKSSGSATTGAQSTIGVASFVNNDNTANPQSAYGAYIETVRASGASTTHGIEVGLTNYGTTVDSSPYNASPTGLTEVARLAVNTGIEAGTKVSHALSIVSVNESPSYDNKFSKGIVFHNMALDGTNGNDGNKATALALARGHSLDWFVYTGSGSGDLGPRLTSNVSVAADAMQQVFENKEVSFNNNVGTQSVAIKNNGIINLKNNTGTVSWTENGDVFVTDNKLYAVLNSVAKEVSFTSSGSRLLSVLTYGATGDGVTNDTTAIQNCINDCFATGANMLVPAGTYLVTALTISSDNYAQHFSIFGEGRNKTIIRKYATSSAVLLTIGDSTPAIFQANVTIEGIQFDGLNTTTAATVRSYDMVRSSFKDCRFYRGAIAYESYGAVANQFYNCMFDTAGFGVKLLWASGLTSSPNETLFNGCQIVDNTLWGLYFEHGALCVLDSCEIEGNGTAGNSSTGGVYVGSLETRNPTLTNSMGVIAQNCWCEANAGRATFYFVDGRNTVENCYFIANFNSTYDLYVAGGTYKASNLSFMTAKTYNIYETASIAVGSIVTDLSGSGFTPTIAFANGRKTVRDYGGVQTGLGSTAADGTLTVTFPRPYPTGTQPVVTCTIIANTTGSITTAEIHTITNTGFSIRTKAYTGGGGAIIGATKEFFWMAAHNG